MRTLLLSILCLLGVAAAPTPCRADLPDDLHTKYIDTVVSAHGMDFRIRRVSPEDFAALHAKHGAAPSRVIRTIDSMLMDLGPEYSVQLYRYRDGDTTYYASDSFSELRREGKFRLLLSHETGGCWYYPAERVVLCEGGHSSDQAFFVDTGESAYNPFHSATQANGRFRIAGLYTGQDSVDYRIEMEDEYRPGNYKLLAHLYEIVRSIPYETFYISWWGYLEAQFWADDTLYVQIGGTWADTITYIAITPLIRNS